MIALKTGGETARDRDQTIKDFGDQWTRHTENPGYYGSVDLFADIIAPFLTLDDIKGGKCAEIGSGTGRIVLMMLAAGAASVTAVEPSRAFDVLVCNTATAGERVRCLNVTGEALPSDGFDIVLSIGVLHHIPDPGPVVKAAYEGLRPGGKMLVWLYGHEGNRTYQSIFVPIRFITRTLPVVMNEKLAWLLYPVVLGYAALARRWLRLPLSNYLANVFMRFPPAERRLVIVDQINPRWAKYYRRDEAEALLRDAGFKEVRLHHRHSYSWTVTGTK
jgi:SAM-dependent methyltransferase